MAVPDAFPETNFSDVTPQWGPIIDLADWKNYNGYPQEKTDQDQILYSIVGGASEWVSTYLDRPIAPTRFQERFDGWTGRDGGVLFLPYYPVLKIEKFQEFWGLSGPHNLVEQTPEHQWGAGNQPGTAVDTYQVSRRTGEIRRTFPGLVQRPFFPGSRNIEITWWAGFNPIPQQIKLATLELASHWYRSTIEQPTIAGSSMYGDINPETPSQGQWPGVPQFVYLMLQQFRQVGIG